MEVEEIRFLRPLSKENVLFLSGIPSLLSWETVWCKLKEIYSVYGLLYSVYVPKDCRAGYALIQYYSGRSALAAMHSTKNDLVIGQAKIKVPYGYDHH